MKEREREYLKQIFGILKEVAFHEIYMENAREQLCLDEYFDPLTSFKCIDTFKHNKIVAYQIFSFLALHQIQSTAEECESIVKAFNKDISYLQYIDFQEFILPQKSALKNLSTTRYSQAQIGVGSYALLTYVKEHTAHLTALFLEKQLNFNRQYLFKRQQFCREYGADIYSMVQHFFKQTQSQINFQTFSELARKYEIFFNIKEFEGIWKRSKFERFRIDYSQERTLQRKQLQLLLLVDNFKTKQKYGLEKNIPLEKMFEKPQPSYMSSFRQKFEEQNEIEKQKREMMSLQDRLRQNKYVMKYKYNYPQYITHSTYQQSQLQDLQYKWKEDVQSMNSHEIDLRYDQIQKKARQRFF